MYYEEKATKKPLKSKSSSKFKLCYSMEEIYIPDILDYREKYSKNRNKRTTY